MYEKLEKKSIILTIIDYEYTVPIIIGVFLIIMAVIMVFYLHSTSKTRSTITTALSLFGSTMLIFNLLIITYRELRKYINTKRNMIIDIDKQVVEHINYIYREMMYNKQYLEQIYDEIIMNKIHVFGNDGKPVLTYHETNFLFMVFSIMLNYYRNYEYNTDDLDTMKNYNSWRAFLLKLMSSPKVQYFYSINKHLFNDIMFNKFMTIYVLPYVELYIPIQNMTQPHYFEIYNKKHTEWLQHKKEQEIQNLQEILNTNPQVVIKPFDTNEFDSI